MLSKATAWKRRLPDGLGLRAGAPPASASPEPAAAGSAEAGATDARTRRRRRNPRRGWKKALAISLLPATGAGGYVAQAAVQTVTIAPARTVSPAPVTLFNMDTARLATGGEYLLNAQWQELAATHGRQAAEDRAGAVVEVARQCAGGGILTPELRRYLIQMVLSGLGGLDPDEAADILELSVDSQNDPLLEPLVKVIEDVSAFGPATLLLGPPPVPPA